MVLCAPIHVFRCFSCAAGFLPLPGSRPDVTKHCLFAPPTASPTLPNPTASPISTSSPSLGQPTRSPASGEPTSMPTIGCADGFNGALCEFSDEVTCNGRGTADFLGVCHCRSGWSAGWTTLGRCNECVSGFLGDDCQYSDATTCSGNGVAASDGACTCAPGYDDADDCATASPTWSPTGSESPTSTPPTTAPTVAAPTAAPVPSVSPTPAPTVIPTSANCPAGTNGPSCQFSDAVTCNGRGNVNYRGICACAPGWSNSWGASGWCSICATDYIPLCTNSLECDVTLHCLYSDTTTCNDHGTVSGADGSCTCAAGYTGDTCEITSPPTPPSASPTPAPTYLTCPGAGIMSFADPLHATRLIGSLDHTIAAHVSITVAECAALCVADDECASFEFKTGSVTTNCNLKRVNVVGAGGTQPSDLFALYERLLICRSTSPTQPAALTMPPTPAPTQLPPTTPSPTLTPTLSTLPPPLLSGCPLASDDGYVFATGTYCPAPFIGPTCALSDAATCNGRGTVSLNAGCNGQCSCPVGWDPTTLPYGGCYTCAAGFLPLPGSRPKIRKHCLYSDATTCNNNGAVDGYGVCTCTPGFTGTACETGGALGLTAGSNERGGNSGFSMDPAWAAGVLVTMAVIGIAVVVSRRRRFAGKHSTAIVTNNSRFGDFGVTTINAGFDVGAGNQAPPTLLPASANQIYKREPVEREIIYSLANPEEDAYDNWTTLGTQPHPAHPLDGYTPLDGATAAETELINQLVRIASTESTAVSVTTATLADPSGHPGGPRLGRMRSSSCSLEASYLEVSSLSRRGSRLERGRSSSCNPEVSKLWERSSSQHYFPTDGFMDQGDNFYTISTSQGDDLYTRY